MSKRNLVITVIVLGAVGVGYWLISPLFITREVNESVEDLLTMAGIQGSGMNQPAATPVNTPDSTPDSAPSTGTNLPPAGQDPRTVSKGPTTPPPALQPSIETVSAGQFTGQDQHNAGGTAKLLAIDGSYFIRFEDDFSVTNGPDLFVGFGKDGEYTTQLAPLKGNVGSQNYEVPAGIDAAAFNEVWVWCRAFSVPFARAVLE